MNKNERQAPPLELDCNGGILFVVQSVLIGFSKILLSKSTCDLKIKRGIDLVVEPGEFYFPFVVLLVQIFRNTNCWCERYGQEISVAISPATVLAVQVLL